MPSLRSQWVEKNTKTKGRFGEISTIVLATFASFLSLPNVSSRSLGFEISSLKEIRKASAAAASQALLLSSLEVVSVGHPFLPSRSIDRPRNLTRRRPSFLRSLLPVRRTPFVIGPEKLIWTGRFESGEGSGYWRRAPLPAILNSQIYPH